MTEQDLEIQSDNGRVNRIVKNEQNNLLKRGKLKIKVYKRRWFMLGIYMYSMSLLIGQDTQYGIISNVLSDFYKVPIVTISSTAFMGRIMYLTFILPMTYVEEKVGLRQTLITSSALCCLGSWIKTFSATPDGFLTTCIGHFIVASTMVMMIPLPGRISACWFGYDQLSTATMFGTLGPLIGISITFLGAPMLVKKHDNSEETANELYFLFQLFAIGATINLILCILFFQDEPKNPPSETRALQKSIHNENKESLIGPVKRLFTNKSYLLFCNTYGLNVGIFDNVNILLNQLIIEHFKNGEEDAGRIGMIISIAGMLGTLALGRILDKTHKFKEAAVTVNLLSFCSQVFFSIAVFMEVMWLIYIAAIFLGFFMAGYLALGYEVASEFTYPESEAYSSGVLNMFNILYDVFLLLLMEFMMEKYGDVSVHVIICVSLLIGTILSAMNKDEHRRQDAKESGAYEVVSQNESVNNDSQL